MTWRMNVRRIKNSVAAERRRIKPKKIYIHEQNETK